MSMKIFVTGATGFLGRHLVRRLRSRGDFVVGLARDAWNESARVGHTTDDKLSVVVCGDLSGNLDRIIAEYEVDAVVHLAAQVQVSVAVDDPTGTFEANVVGTQRVLEACRRQKKKRLIVASSDKYYADGPAPYVEDQPTRAHGVYATSKTMADMLAQAYIRDFDMPIAITRCGNLYGPGHENYSTLIPGTIRSVMRGERPVLRSDGKQARDYLYVDDAVDGYLALLDSAETRGAFNFGTGYARSALYVVTSILSSMGSDLDPDVRGTRAAAGEISRQFLGISRATGELCWHPKTTFDEGLKKTIEWYAPACRGCGKALLPKNERVADGCPCNTPRGINHGLVPKNVCTCDVCDPEQTGSVR